MTHNASTGKMRPERITQYRVRLWPCKIDLSPPVTVCYSFQVDTSVVVLFVLCLGV